MSNGKLTSATEQQILTKFSYQVPQFLSQTNLFNGRLGHWQQKRSGFGGLGRLLDLTTLTTALGIDQSTLQSDFGSGQSIADIAQGKGVSEKAVIAYLQSGLQTKLNQVVASGQLSTADEQQLLSKFNSRVQQLVEQKVDSSGGLTATIVPGTAIW